MFIVRYSTLLFALLAGLAGIGSCGAAQPAELQIRIEKSGGGMHVTASMDTRQKTFSLDAASVFDLIRIYASMECRDERYCDAGEPWKTPSELEQSLKEQGSKFFGPIDQEVREASVVRFKADQSLLQLPFDALFFDGKPLFIQKPVFFIVGEEIHESRFAPVNGGRGILVSDATADPERAVFAVARLYPEAKSFDISEFGLKNLPGLGPLDFMVISAHSSVGNSGGEDYIGIAKGEKLTAASFAQIKPKLVLLDSCKIGVSSTFIDAIKLAGSKYLLAPILSNEAGNSSTMTISAVFDSIAKGADPVTAMFRARTLLYDTYRADELRTLLWRAFPFRVYQLN
jgi:hypothetical protein